MSKSEKSFKITLKRCTEIEAKWNKLSVHVAYYISKGIILLFYFNLTNEEPRIRSYGNLPLLKYRTLWLILRKWRRISWSWKTKGNRKVRLLHCFQALTLRHHHYVEIELRLEEDHEMESGYRRLLEQRRSTQYDPLYWQGTPHDRMLIEWVPSFIC